MFKQDQFPRNHLEIRAKQNQINHLNLNTQPKYPFNTGNTTNYPSIHKIHTLNNQIQTHKPNPHITLLSSNNYTLSNNSSVNGYQQSQVISVIHPIQQLSSVPKPHVLPQKIILTQNRPPVIRLGNNQRQRSVELQRHNSEQDLSIKKMRNECNEINEIKKIMNSEFEQKMKQMGEYFSELIKNNNEDIKKLEKLLKNNQQILEQKQKQMLNLRTNYYNTLEQNNFLKLQINRKTEIIQNNQKYQSFFIPKIRDLQIKIQILLKQSQSFSQYTFKFQTLSLKLDDILKEFCIIQNYKLNMLDIKLQQYLNSKKKFEQLTQESIERINIQRSRIQNFLENLNKQIIKYYSKYQKQNQQLKKYIKDQQNRLSQFNTQVQFIVQNLKSTNQKICNLQQSKSQQFKQIQNHCQLLMSTVYSNTLVNSTKSPQLKRTGTTMCNQDKKICTSKSQKNIWISRVNSLKNYNQTTSSFSIEEQCSNSDYFFYPNQKNKLNILNYPKIQRLKKILKSRKFQLPFKIEIDQTGYLKDYQSGMYIYDEQQNLFVLSQVELEYGIKANIIIL